MKGRDANESASYEGTSNHRLRNVQSIIIFQQISGLARTVPTRLPEASPMIRVALVKIIFVFYEHAFFLGFFVSFITLFFCHHSLSFSRHTVSPYVD